jgi:hypothetical protein
MARIKIKDLPKDMKISTDEMRRIHGGGSGGEDRTLALFTDTRFISVEGESKDENHDKWIEIL